MPVKVWDVTSRRKISHQESSSQQVKVTRRSKTIITMSLSRLIPPVLTITKTNIVDSVPSRTIYRYHNDELPAPPRLPAVTLPTTSHTCADPVPTNHNHSTNRHMYDQTLSMSSSIPNIDDNRRKSESNHNNLQFIYNEIV